MTDPDPIPPAPRPRRWVAVLLGLSLAANLLVVGVIVGTLGWRGGGGPMVRSAPVEVSFFPYTEALAPQDRAAIRRDWSRSNPAPRAVLDERRQEAAELAALLRADPFAPDTVTALLEARAQRLADRQALAFAALRDRLLAMDPEARAAYAYRLEAAAERGPRRPADRSSRRGE